MSDKDLKLENLSSQLEREAAKAEQAVKKEATAQENQRILQINKKEMVVYIILVDIFCEGLFSVFGKEYMFIVIGKLNYLNKGIRTGLELKVCNCYLLHGHLFYFQMSLQKQLRALQEENRTLQQALGHAPSHGQLEEAHRHIGKSHQLKVNKRQQMLDSINITLIKNVLLNYNFGSTYVQI